MSRRCSPCFGSARQAGQLSGPSQRESAKVGAPRTQKGAIDVGEAPGSDAVREMKELALRSRPAGGGFKPPPAALAEDRRGERGGKGVVRGVRWGPGRRCAAP